MDTVINDIFERYQVRKTRKQKTAFIAYAESTARADGYEINVEKGALGARNIVVGSPESAKVIYTAHYDTCARLPFPNFITPKNFFVYILYNVAVILGFFLVAGVAAFALGFVAGLLNLPLEIATGVFYIVYFGMLLLIMFGPANKHTANDNTSGVTTLFAIMKALPAELRDNVAFIFFDHEETGLIGSSSFAAKHKNIKKNTLLVNFDCVSDGKNILLALKKGALPYSEQLSEAFAAEDEFSIDVTSSAFYPSDQAKFNKGVGVAALKKTKRGLLYMNRIHTKHDTVYQRENIDFLARGAVKLAALMTEDSKDTLAEDNINT